MNFLHKSDSASEDHEELDLPAVRLFAVSEMRELNMDDKDDLPVSDKIKPETTARETDQVSEKVIESELDLMLQEQIAAQSGDTAQNADEAEQFLSARILKIRDKQTTCGEMKGQIAQGTALLRDLAAKADLLTRYLDSAEVELSQLEAAEQSSEKLGSFNRTLSQQYEEAKEKLDEQQTLLDFMESEKTKSRNTIEMARKEIARLLEYKREQAVEMSQLKSALARAQNDHASIEEKLEAAERTRKDIEIESERRLQRIHQFENLRKESEKTIASLRTRNDELDQELQRSAVNLSDMRLKHSDANSRVLGLQTQLEEMSHELSGLKREAENNARLKEKRIVELEARLTGSVDHSSGRSPSMMTPEAPASSKKGRKASEKHALSAVSDLENSAA